MSALKTRPRGAGNCICVGCAHTYTVPLIAVDLFSVAPYYFFPTDRNPCTNNPRQSDIMPLVSGDNEH